MEGERERFQSVLSALLLAAGASVVPIWLALCRDSRSWLTFWEALSMTGAILLCHALAARKERLAGNLLLLGMAAAPLAAGALSGCPAWFSLLAVPIVATGMLFHPWTAAASAVLAMVAVTLLAGAMAAVWPYLFLFFVTGLTASLGVGAERQLLRVHQRRSLYAYDLVTTLRQRQGELNKTVSALDTAYRLLEESNYQLATARHEAEQWRDLKTRFATNLSHELRTPLNIILGFSKLIYRSPQLYGFSGWPESLMRDLVQVQRNASYLSDLVDDIVDMARVDALAMPIRREPTEMSVLVKETVRALESLAHEKGLATRIELDASLPVLSVDPVRVRQVLYNLLANAIRYTDSGSVTVTAKMHGREVIVSVSDTGRGMPPDQLDVIFDEFRQLGKPKKDGDEGKGLGLAIAKRFVQLHGGRIWVESVVGEGSTFYFSLPLEDKTVARLARRSHAPLPRLAAKPKVIVLDEDGIATNYLRRQLEAYDFLTVADWEQFEEVTASIKPLAIIVNVLPEDGERDVHDLSQFQGIGDVPIIRCTLPSTRWLSGDHQFRAVLAKPVSDETLLKTLQEALCVRGGKTVLVVDDDRGFVQLIRRMLSANAGDEYRVVAAYNGREAIEKARSVKPDAVLLDLVMPEMNGFDVVRLMEEDEALRDIPTIAVTAASPGEDGLSIKGASFSVVRQGDRSRQMVLDLVAATLAGANSVHRRVADTAV